VSPAFAAQHGLDAGVEIVAQALTTDVAEGLDSKSMMRIIGTTWQRCCGSGL